VGQYGLEREIDGEVVSDPRAAAFEPAVARAADDATARWPALTVERKGTVAFTVHWRTNPSAVPSDEELGDLAQRAGLEALPGRMACEFRPPIDVDKGTAVATVLADRDLAAVAYAGDDRGDWAAFVALARWARAGRARAALRIAVASPESPTDLLDEADLSLDGPAALAAQLDALARAMAAARGASAS
jgi:trehalose 6-phosphate phosphatase